MPRPYNPQASKQEQEDFKNDFPNKVKEAERQKTQKIVDLH